MANVELQPDRAQLTALYKALRTMDKEANGKLKDQVASISKWTAQEIIHASYSAPMPAQAAVVASSVRFNRDRIPNVVVGGTKGKKTSNGTNAGILLKGNEYGASPTSENGRFPNGGRRFPYRSPRLGRGNAGYWIEPTKRAVQPEITRRWKAAVTEVLNNWNKGAGGGIG